MKLDRPLALVAMALLAAATSVQTSAGQGTYNRAAFETAMDAAMKNLRVVMGSLVAGDWAKAEASANSLAGDAKSIRALTPKVSPDRIGEFQAHADSLAVRGARIAAAAKTRTQDAAGAELGRAVGSCMGCHAVFRK